MAFTEAERVKVRKWLGFGAQGRQADPRLESAMSAIQSTADGGTRPDNSSELAVRGYLTVLDALELKLDGMADDEGDAVSIDEMVVSAPQATMLMQMKGRRYVGHLCDVLELTGPRRDVFAPPKVNRSGETFRAYDRWSE